MRLWTISLLALPLLYLSYCGLDEGDDKKDNSGTPPVNTIESLPNDWDGTTDWEGSKWQVEDL